MLQHVDIYEGERLKVGGPLTPHDFDALVRFNDHHGRRYFSVGHKSLTATGHVGYLEVGRFAIELLPKASTDQQQPKEAWRRGLLHMIGVATGLRLDTPSLASQAAGRSSLLEIIALRFVVEVERLLHEGLARGYRARAENGPAFRGRLLVSQHLRDNLVRPDRFYVEHHAYEHDIAVNQIVRLGLDALGGLALSPGVSARAAACASWWPEVASAAATTALFQRVRITRATARYQDALILARMLLEHRAPELRHGASAVFAILFEMDNLWERYVTWLFRKAVPSGSTVDAQYCEPFWLVPGQPARNVRPDVVVTASSSAGRLVADAKWKVPDGGPSMADLRQMFTYNELLRSQRALLVYPATSASRPTTGSFVGRHDCEALHVELFEKQQWSPTGMLAQVAAAVRRGLPSPT